MRSPYLIHTDTTCKRPDGSRYGTRGKCRKGRETSGLGEGAGEVARNVASWAVGKAIGGAIAATAEAHGIPGDAAKLLAESGAQALAAVAIAHKQKGLNVTQATKMFLTEASGALLGKASLGVDDAILGGDREVADLVASLAGRSTINAVTATLANHGRVLHGLLNRNTRRDAFGLSEAEAFALLALTIGARHLQQSQAKEINQVLKTDRLDAIALLRRFDEEEGTLANPALHSFLKSLDDADYADAAAKTAKELRSGGDRRDSRSCKPPWKGTLGGCTRGTENPSKRAIASIAKGGGQTKARKERVKRIEELRNKQSVQKAQGKAKLRASNARAVENMKRANAGLLPKGPKVKPNPKAAIASSTGRISRQEKLNRIEETRARIEPYINANKAKQAGEGHTPSPGSFAPHDPGTKARRLRAIDARKGGGEESVDRANQIAGLAAQRRESGNKPYQTRSGATVTPGKGRTPTRITRNGQSVSIDSSDRLDAWKRISTDKTFALRSQ